MPKPSFSQGYKKLTIEFDTKTKRIDCAKNIQNIFVESLSGLFSNLKLAHILPKKM